MPTASRAPVATRGTTLLVSILPKVQGDAERAAEERADDCAHANGHNALCDGEFIT